MAEEEENQDLMVHRVIPDESEDYRTTYSVQPLSRFQLFKMTLAGLVGLVLTAGFLFLVFIIGFIVTLPLVLAGFIWYLRLRWRGRFR